MATQQVETRSATVAALVGAGFVGLSAAQFTAALNLLPRLVENIVGGDRKVAVFSLLVVGGAVVGIVAAIITGLLSDRAGRRRRPWIVGGTATAGVGLVALPLQGSVTTLAACWIVLQIGLSVAGAGIGALVPDHVPRDRLGAVSALAGIGQVLGAVLGIGAVALPGTPPTVDALLVAVLVTAFLLPAGLVRVAAPPTGSRSVGADGGSYADFRWAWCTRVTVALSNIMMMTYLLYYLTDAVKHPDPTHGQFVMVVAAGACFTVTAVISGWLSDRYRRRKALVVASMVTMAAGEAVLAAWALWPAAIVAAIVFGTGYGVYLAIDQALITEVLPRRDRVARDLGIINIANATPHLVGPLVAAPLVAGYGYSGLYAVTAVFTLCGVLFVLPIRRVR